MNKKFHISHIAGKNEAPTHQQKPRAPQEPQTKTKEPIKKKNFTRATKRPKEIELLLKKRADPNDDDLNVDQVASEESSDDEDEDYYVDDSDSVPDLVLIQDQLYLGTLRQTRSKAQLEKFSITHVLTLLKGETRQSVLRDEGSDQHIIHLIIPVDDSENEDMMQYMDKCADFIKDAISQKNHNVLVHDDNSAIASRSTTAILAYLIREKNMGVEDGIEFINQRRTDAEPSEAFLRQINRYYIKQKKQQRELGAKKQAQEVEQLSSEELREQRIKTLKNENTSHDNENESQDSTAFCKRCREELFTTKDLIEHQDAGQKGFTYKKIKKDAANALTPDQSCNSLFVKRMPWMGEMLDNEGKLTCPKCAARIGSYSWSGSQCSCGKWVNPSFAVLKTRVD
ncbi:tyrosine-protein phosphatase [Acrasis kona]|uniref:protein-tyrosine-phosphatase n=1 Tax=Acrasis kona TaxID=1008807 RepID=A0AAW2ZN09_9EUKA